MWHLMGLMESLQEEIFITLLTCSCNGYTFYIHYSTTVGDIVDLEHWKKDKIVYFYFWYDHVKVIILDFKMYSVSVN